jgi:hypothetical protein
MRARFIPVLGFVLTILLVAGCAKKEAPAPPPPAAETTPPPSAAVTVTAVDVGRTLNPDKSIGEPTSSFKPMDTIYASVATQGTGTAVIVARWVFEGSQVIDESTQTISPTEPARTEFHISKPDGWPAGRYRVEVTIHGTNAGAKEFTVS